MKNDRNISNNEYLTYINKWGKVTNWIGVILAFGPPLVLAVVFKIMPPINAILTGFISMASAIGVLWFVEPISFFPIIGVAGTYMAFMSGNISNLRIPCAAVAQNVAGVKPGTEEGSIISTIGMATSIVVNILILTVGVFAGSKILALLPQNIINALDYLMPALFGAVFIQFALMKLKLAPIALGLALGLTFALKAGLFNFLPGNPTYIITLGSVLGTIGIATLLYKKNKLQ